MTLCPAGAPLFAPYSPAGHLAYFTHAYIDISCIVNTCIVMRAILPGGCGYFYPAQISAGVCLYLVFDHAQISPSPGGAVPLFGGLARGGSSNSAVFCKQGGPRSKKLNTPRNGFIAWVPDIPDIFCIPCWCSVIHTAIFL